MTVLREFFGNFQHDFSNTAKGEKDVFSQKTELTDEQLDDLFWFIIDHDDMHMEHVLPLAKKIKKLQKQKKFDHGKFVKEWMPVVNKGCAEFYKHKKMTADPKDIFTTEVRKGLCHRLADHYHRDIEKGEYMVGESKNRKIKEIGQAQMAGPSGPQYDTTGNNRLEEKTKQRLDPKCWKGYRKSGTKLKSRGKGKGKIRVNNCVPKEGINPKGLNEAGDRIGAINTAAQLKKAIAAGKGQPYEIDLLKRQLAALVRKYKISPEELNNPNIGNRSRQPPPPPPGGQQRSQQQQPPPPPPHGNSQPPVGSKEWWDQNNKMMKAGMDSMQATFNTINAAGPWNMPRNVKEESKDRNNNCVKVGESWENRINKYVQLLEKKNLGK